MGGRHVRKAGVGAGGVVVVVVRMGDGGTMMARRGWIELVMPGQGHRLSRGGSGVKPCMESL